MIMKTVFLPVHQVSLKKKIFIWLSHENSLLTTIMGGETVTNRTMLKIANAIHAFCFLLFSPNAMQHSIASGYLAMGTCLIWFIVSLHWLLKKGKNNPLSP